MSFENTACPCGGKKDCDTMLCDLCESKLADHPAMATFKDPQAKTEWRRHAAIVLVTQSRSLGRKQRLSPIPALFVSITTASALYSLL